MPLKISSVVRKCASAHGRGSYVELLCGGRESLGMRLLVPKPAPKSVLDS